MRQSLEGIASFRFIVNGNGYFEMNSTILFMAFAGAAALLIASALVAALWRHKRASAGEVKLIGEIGYAESPLDPEGSVIVGGELWRAISFDALPIAANARVRVVGLRGHLVLVETA